VERLRKFFYHAVGCVGWFFTLVGALLAYSPHYPKPGSNPVRDFVLGQLIDLTPYTALTVAMGAFLIGAQRKIREPWVRPSIKKTLDIMREDAFAGQGQQLEHYQRVTLFKARSFCWNACWGLRWPFGTWLVPFARSGPSAAGKSKAHFKVTSDPDKAEGVAGAAYARDMVMPVEGLPNVARSNVGEKALITYAKEAYVDLQWVREKRPKSRSIIGLPVRVGGKIWGVLVLDSRDPRFADYENVIKSVQLGARVLTVILERS
jgi:hypothetical protein